MCSALFIRPCCSKVSRLYNYLTSVPSPPHILSASVSTSTYSQASSSSSSVRVRSFSSTSIPRQEPQFLTDPSRDGQEEALPARSGFFPAGQDYDPPQSDPQSDQPDNESNSLIQKIDPVVDQNPSHYHPSTSKLDTRRVPRLFRRKVSLQGFDPQDPHAPAKARARLRNTNFSTESTPHTLDQSSHQPFFHHSYPLRHSFFRTSGLFRRLTAAYIDCILPHHSPHLWGNPHDTVDSALLQIFSPNHVRSLNKSGYQPEHVQTWAWILHSNHTDAAIHRYLAVHASSLESNTSVFPPWLVLQLLRSTHINAAPLAQLIAHLLNTPDSASFTLPTPPDTSTIWVLDLSQDLTKPQPIPYWDNDSATLLCVRLLRHARRACPTALEDIAKVACRILLPLHHHGPSAYERLSYSCNRLLTLIALPASERPFYSVAYQQRAQLVLLDAMSSQSPAIPLNREGYRALIKVQLLHEKLDPEKDWSSAQGPAWPPWPKPKLGIDQDTDYPGKESRTMKVLRRMREAGYAHYAWERIASVLAGWDTDKSPTIQTRHIIQAARAAPLTDLLSNDASMRLVQQLWAARITATRSVREAWACFSSYCATNTKEFRDLHPYHAMFNKLLASSQKIEPDSLVLPGDAKETFPDPPSPRDLVFVDSQPPTLQDLYRQMLADGIKPAGRLLSDLMSDAGTLEQGFQYLHDSGYNEVKKDVLANINKYPTYQGQDVLKSVPGHFLAAYVGMLVRCTNRPGVAGSASSIPHGFNSPRSGVNYALLLLHRSETDYLPAWHAVMRALLGVMKEAQHSGMNTFKPWKQQSRKLISSFPLRNIDTDFTFYRLVQKMLHIRVQPVGSSPRYPNLDWEGRLELLKTLFTRALYRLPVSWITKVGTHPVLSWPEPDALGDIITALGIAEDTEGLLDLVDWQRANAAYLRAFADNRKMGARLTRINMIFLRVFLEELWMHDPYFRKTPALSEEKRREVRSAMHDGLGWPSYGEVGIWLEGQKEWVKGIREVILARRKAEGLVEWKRFSSDETDETGECSAFSSSTVEDSGQSNEKATG